MDNQKEYKANLPKRGRGRPRAFNSASDLADKISAYFEDRAKRDMPPLMVGLSLWLEISRDTLAEYAKGAYDDALNEYSDTIERAKDYIEYDKCQGAYSGKYNCRMVIFDLINNHGWGERMKTQQAYNAPKPQTAPPLDPPMLKEEAERIYREFRKRTDSLSQ